MAISGDTALMGAPGRVVTGTFNHVGAVYVGNRNGALWNITQQLMPPDGVEGDQFGSALAVEGTWAAVGAPGTNIYSGGSVYVYRDNGSTWVYSQTLIPPDNAPVDVFGVSVAISGQTMVVGAYGRQTYSGAAYVYKWNGSTWSLAQTLTAPDAAAYDFFGYSADVSGNVIIVGAYGDDVVGGNSGSAYVYRFNGSTWVYSQKLLPSDGMAGDSFGWSVAFDGEFAVVGAPIDDNYAGSAYLFRDNGSTFQGEGKVVASDRMASDRFAQTVGIANSGVLVGALNWTNRATGNSQQGKAYYFHRSVGGDGLATWREEFSLLQSAPWGYSYDHFGSSVALDGDTAVVGAPDEDSPAPSNSGKAYFFDVTCTPPDPGCATNAECDDGLYCNGAEICQSGACVPGPAPCPGPDGDGVCAESCNETLNNCAAPDPNGSACNDGNACTTGETCTTGVCGGGAAVNCNDNNACTTDTCVPAAGCTYVNVLNGTACGNSATTDCDNPDSCNNGACVPNYDPNGTLCTDDGNACTNDTCNGAGSCIHPNKTNGTACGSAANTDCDNPDTCNNGTCAANYDPSGMLCTDDGNTCTSDTCNGAGSCTHPNKANGTACGSAVNTDCDNPDTCNNGACAANYEPSGTLCTDDGNPNTTDTCNGSGTCQHNATGCPDDGNPCTNEVLSGGVCTHPAKANGTACGSPATTDCDNPDTCNNGTCVPNFDPSGTLCVDDVNLCTNDICNGAGSCTHPIKANGTACGIPTTADCDNQNTCNNGTCMPNYDPLGTPCTDDGNVCTNDVCNGAGSCTHSNKTNGTSCSDGNVCNGAETCQNGACAPGTVLNCNDSNACTSDTCVPATGCAHNNVVNGTACGSQITTDCDNPDTCNNGTCVPNYDPSGTLCANDGNACTNDACNGAGVCAHAPITCPAGQTCVNGVCVSPCNPSGAACTTNSQCCSNNCKGPNGRKTCR